MYGIRVYALLILALGLTLLCLLFFFPWNDDANLIRFTLGLTGGMLSFGSIALFQFDKELARRKRAAVVIGVISVILFFIAWFFKLQHWFGAAFIVVSAVLLFTCSFLPLHTKNRVEKWRQYTRKGWHAYLLSWGDLISIGSVVMGFAFKILHWPYGTYLMLFGSVVLAIGVLAWNQLFSREIVLRKKAEDETTLALGQLQKQHDIIEEKNSEIMDSIRYARHLQSAILPTRESISEAFSDSFLFFRPKDIVAGDFYWMERSGDVLFIAAADCTGHGVPGALVSVVCSTALNRSVKEFGLTDPGKILDKTRELIIETFKKSDSEIKDGMDISLMSIRSVGVNEYSLGWSGANNPLWMIKSGVFTKIAPDKQPVGAHIDPKPFSTNVFMAPKGDAFFLFTDGFADQFGGPVGKKMKYAKLEAILTENQSNSLVLTGVAVEKYFDAWKGSLEQLDDVCVIGFRL